MTGRCKTRATREGRVAGIRPFSRSIHLPVHVIGLIRPRGQAQILVDRPTPFLRLLYFWYGSRLTWQAHDLDNLNVVDAFCFVSASGVNPSLTITANAIRIADHLLAERLR